MARSLRRQVASPLTTSTDALELYRAYGQCYATEANRRSLAFYVDLAFAIAALILTALTVGESAPALVDFLNTWLPLAALLWLAVREIEPISADKVHRREAVNIQEQFDLTFWKGSDWSRHWNRLLAGEPVQSRRIKQLAAANPTATLSSDYWVNTNGLAGNDAALFRIEQTAAWGAVGHRRYAKLNRWPAWVGMLAVLIGAVIVDVSARDTAAAMLSVAPFLVGRIQSARDHGALAERRELLERHIQGVLDPKRPSSDTDVRTAQAELYRIRIEHRRIPSWLYARYADRDRRHIDAAVEERINEFRDAMSAGPV